MRAYLYDNLDTDCREPHELIPSVPVSAEELAASGVLYWRLEDENFEAQIDKICEERNYKNRDQITVSKEGLGAVFDEKIKTFFAEHLHEDEEIRAILDGTGYFDIRDRQDRWVRIKVEAGDLIVLPAGIYHRFTLDTNNYLKAMRLFKEDPVWTPLNRPCDENSYRKLYLESPRQAPLRLDNPRTGGQEPQPLREMDARQMALEKVPHAIHIQFSFPPYPGADLKTIHVDLPEGALLLDAIRQTRNEHNVPVYLEHSLLSTAQSLIQSTRRAKVIAATRQVNERVFSKSLAITDATEDLPASTKTETRTDKVGIESGKDTDSVREPTTQEPSAVQELEELQKAMIDNYRTHTSQFYTQPEENMFPEAYHTLVHSPIPHLFDAILDLEREYAGEVDALLSARDAEIEGIQTRHNNALAGETPQRGLTHLMTRHIESMEVAQATWNSQLDDLQAAQRSKYQEFILELYAIYKRCQLSPSLSDSRTTQGLSNSTAQLDGKEMVAEVMRTIGARRSNVEETPSVQEHWAPATLDNNSLPEIPQVTPAPVQSPVSESGSTQEALESSTTMVNSVQEHSNPTPPPPPKKDDPELDQMIKSILEMGFDMEQAKGALLIANRNMDHAINLLLEQPDSIPRLVAAKQKVDAMKENARRQNRAQSSPQQVPPSLISSPSSNSIQSQPSSSQDTRALSASRPLDRSHSVSSPRPMMGSPNQGPGGNPNQKAWSPLPFFQQQKNALLTNNTNPSVKKFGGWLNRAIENLGLDDDMDNVPGAPSRNNVSSPNGSPMLPPQPASNLAESFTVVLGSSHSKVTHNLRLMVSDPAEVFPSNRNKSERDAAIQAQTASSLYGQNLTGLVQLVNIRDWAEYKGGQVCHQEFFKACQTSTELHFDSIEKQLEAIEDEIPLDGSTLREGDFILTRHSNLPMIHVVFHLFYGQSVSPDDRSPPALFSQSSDFSPKPDFLAGLRNIIMTAHRYEITMLSLPFLMMPQSFENQMMMMDTSSQSRHIRHGSQQSHYRSSSLSAVPSANSNLNGQGSVGSSAVSSPSASSMASFSTSASSHSMMANNNINGNSGNGNGNVSAGNMYYISDQTRRDLQRRADSLLRHLKAFLVENARQVKQVGNQGSEAEKFRASQGGDVKVVQFLLPKGTSDEMFRSFRLLLTSIFGGA
ncbi:hypothetical protein KVV02_008739 [Mortierella alpina]|uniref:Acireductone dioxygenase n=1 Tax=Mortierella alpina TaxID=64518 RepID=A0A9P8IE82_MORAP|nr:hypothetical protein KVV02_008739 [Mortierella alpina]